jgi:signal peptidase I
MESILEQHDQGPPVLAEGQTEIEVTDKAPASYSRAIREFLEVVLIAGVLFLIVNVLTARVRVESISMLPNLHEGEFVVVNRLAYRWEEPIRGDIIVFRFPGNEEKRYIKRVIGVGGDLVSIHDGQVTVNGSILEEPYIAAPPVYEGEWYVKPGDVFVLGDNRNNSNDSKNWVTLERKEIIGKAVFIYWPPTEIGLIPHYDLFAGEEG